MLLDTCAVIWLANGDPGALQGDPGDRLIIATARYFGLPFVTRDQKIIDYAGDGHVQAIGC